METFSSLRKQAKLTQRAISEDLGITNQSVSQWERGINEPNLSPKRTLRLCELLGVDLDTLVEAIENTMKEV